MVTSQSSVTVTPVSSRKSKFPVLRIVSGRCNYLITVGKLTTLCPCTEFSGTSQNGQLNIICEKCDHPLTQHGDASSVEIDSTQQGSRQLEKASKTCPYLSSRSETVSKMAELVDSQKVVHVRGTPASGKSTLATLLLQYLEAMGRTVVLTETWNDLDGYPFIGDNGYLHAWSKLNEMLRTKFNPSKDYLAPGTIIIIDEAQRTYTDVLFWNSIIKPRLSQEGLDINFCLFCCYGSPSSGVDREFGVDISAFTPAQFRPAQCVTLTPQSHRSSPQIGLFFNRTEFSDAAQRLIANTFFQEKFTLSADAEEYLFSLTNGHPGGLNSVLRYIHDFYRHDLKRRAFSVITKEHLANSFENDNKVWDQLAVQPISRSLPDGLRLTAEVADLLAKVLEEGNVPCEPSKEAEVCYKLGWLHRIQTLGEDGYNKDVYVLPSRLHEKWIEHYIGKRAKSLPPKFQNLRDLTLTILSKFSSSNLRHSAQGKTMSSGAQPKPVEAQYQDEFYRCFSKTAGRGVPVCTEWSRTADGRVDFWIPGRKWAVEFVREHDRINDHIARFYKDGRYYPWQEEGMIQDWIIVNCTTSPPKLGYEETRLIHAVFASDFTQLAIFDHQNNVLQTFFLHN